MKEYKKHLKVGDKIMFKTYSVELLVNKNLSSTKKYKVTYVRYMNSYNSTVLIKIRGIEFVYSGIFGNPIVYCDGVEMENMNSSLILSERCSSIIQEELEI